MASDFRAEYGVTGFSHEPSLMMTKTAPFPLTSRAWTLMMLLGLLVAVEASITDAAAILLSSMIRQRMNTGQLRLPYHGDG